MNDEERRKYFATMIADIIQELLRESHELSAILEEANEDGYDIFLTLFSGIMIRQKEEAGKKKTSPLPKQFVFTHFDKEFLKSIGIQVPDEDAPS